MQDTPSSDLILEAVADFLQEEVMPDYEGRKAFQVRIAASVCRIIAREIRLDAGFLEDEHEALAGVLGSDAPLPRASELRPAVAAMLTDLSQKLRAGEIDQDAPDVRAAALQQAVDKLRVVNPQYLD